MSKRAGSWRRPLGIVVGIAVGLLAVGWTAAGAVEKPGEREHGAAPQLSGTHGTAHPVSRDREGRLHGRLELRLGDERFYWNRSARLFVPPRWVDHRFGRRAPEGTAFLDPFSGKRYKDLLRFRRHMEDAGHPPVLDIVRLRQRPDRGWERRDR